tara:strand:- start:379 stop:639 length:261 start_codon:yes stop_codon:yes gene_type:complete
MATVTWLYSDWRSQSTVALQLDRLKLHMQEVSGFVLESSAKARMLRLDTAYMPMLNTELQRLEAKLSISAAGARFGVSSFLRGGGA